VTKSSTTLRLKLCAKGAAKLDSGQKFIIQRTETGLLIKKNTYLIPTISIQTGFKCTQSWKISGKSMVKDTAPNKNTHLWNQSP